MVSAFEVKLLNLKLPVRKLQEGEGDEGGVNEDDGDGENIQGVENVPPVGMGERKGGGVGGDV